MKNTIRKLTTLFVMLLLLMSMATTAFADGSITFKGFGSNQGFDFSSEGQMFTETDLFGSFKGVMPGDVLSEDITFTNKDTKNSFVKLYMRAEPHVKEDETVLDFLKQLSMKVWNGTELIYDSTLDKSAQLTEKTYLGAFHSGDTAKLHVELTVPLEMDNTYANKVGEVDWIFTVEGYSTSQVTVRKVWADGEAKHEEDTVTVTLLKDGKTLDSQQLSALNDWTYTWKDVDLSGNWQIKETKMPRGYVPSYRMYDGVVVITNSRGLIQTGQLNWPIWLLTGAGIVLIILGGTMMLKKKKENHA